jgi:hypothetical protein
LIVVLPLHLNPTVRDALLPALRGEQAVQCPLDHPGLVEGRHEECEQILVDHVRPGLRRRDPPADEPEPHHLDEYADNADCGGPLKHLHDHL